MTLRAVRALQAAHVIALPRSSDYGASMAWRIVRPVIGEIPGQERLFLTFPMNKDPERLRPAWDRAFEAIGERLERGLSVAFVTEGDPSLYSTFIYLQREAPRRWPGIDVEIVPGVSSIAISMPLKPTSLPGRGVRGLVRTKIPLLQPLPSALQANWDHPQWKELLEKYWS